jgi:uncharacterized protein YuzE
MSRYASDVDIAFLTLAAGQGRPRAEETEWGLLVYDTETGTLIGAEIWDAKTRLPAELLAALPEPAAQEVTVERQSV